MGLLVATYAMFGIVGVLGTMWYVLSIYHNKQDMWIFIFGVVETRGLIKTKPLSVAIENMLLEENVCILSIKLMIYHFLLISTILLAVEMIYIAYLYFATKLCQRGFNSVLNTLKPSHRAYVLVKSGRYDSDGYPLICDCGCTDFKEIPTDYIATVMCEYDIICSCCNKHIGSYAYGKYDFGGHL